MTTQNLIHNLPLNSKSIIEKFGEIKDKEYIVLFDLELTCWEDRIKTRNEGEILQIGFIILNKYGAEIEGTSRYSSLIKPINYELTSYCKALLNLKQEDITDRETLNDVIKYYLTENILPNPKKFIFACWGTDTKRLIQELKNKNSDIEFDPRYINIKECAKSVGLKGGLRDCLESLGYPFEGTQHDALVDSINTLKIFEYLQLSTEDCLVSQERTYKQALSKALEDRVLEFAKKFHIQPDSAKKILTFCNWDFTKASSFISIAKTIEYT